MNFDTKFLIRWGIPGWVFIIFIGSMILFENYSNISQITNGIGTALGLLVSLGFFGVTLGYLMHQVYFSFNWTNKKKKSYRIIDDAVLMIRESEKIKNYKNHTWGRDYHEDYYLFEFQWHKELLNQEPDKRDYITDRYRHLLSTIHALGALKISLYSSLIFNVVMLVISINPNGKVSDYFIPFIIIGLNVYLTYVSHKGFEYYSSNLNHFQGYFLDSFYEEKATNTSNENGSTNENTIESTD
ncbi:hypothetical protein ABE042_21960 [Viridibacillus arvi]|uniref:hypothetical protein n=1 Tax=Viridibacillus arvi TaxID=263475 RepID=UPI003D2B831E